MESAEEDFRIKTHSGIYFDLKNPTPGMVNIRDIAWHLSRLCRFTGACNTTNIYSVAEHSILVANLACTVVDTVYTKKVFLYALLHDAHEAYTGDINRPLKKLLGPNIKVIEARIQNAVHEAVGIPVYHPWHLLIKGADNTALEREQELFMRGSLYQYAPTTLTPAQAEREFLSAFWGCQ